MRKRVDVLKILVTFSFWLECIEWEAIKAIQLPPRNCVTLNQTAINDLLTISLQLVGIKRLEALDPICLCLFPVNWERSDLESRILDLLTLKVNGGIEATL